MKVPLSLACAFLLSSVALAADTYQYDPNGVAIGLTATVDGLTLSVSAPTDGTISAQGMPTVRRIKNAQGRLQNVQGPTGGNLVAFAYETAGTVKSVQLPWNLSLQISPPAGGVVTQKVMGPSGPLTTVNVQDGYGHGRWHLLTLDMFLEQFGLGYDWFEKVTIEYNPTFTIATVRNPLGTRLFYLLIFGQVRVGFDLSGNGIFYDIDATPDITDGPSGLAPTRIIIAKDQRVQLQAPGTTAGAIESIWIDRTSTGAQQRKYRTLQFVSYNTPVPLLYAWCGSSTVCWTSGNQGGCTTTNYYCDEGAPGGGRCYDCAGEDPPTGGGGGGNPHANNRLTNPMTKAAVSKAIESALTKLASQNCKNVFSQFTNPDGRTAKQVLDQDKGKTETAWLNTFVLFYQAPGGAPQCNSAVAYTEPGSTGIRICPNFHGYQFNNPGKAACTVIHETLHSLGLSENPPTPGQPTSALIQAAVENKCGTAP